MANTSPKVQKHSFTMRTDDEFVAMVDELRARLTPVPSKSDAIRWAVAAELARLRGVSEKSQ